MKRYWIGLLLGVLSLSVWADDTIRVVSDTYAGVYADTVQVEELTETADMDAYLLELVAEQTRKLLEREQRRQDSIRLAMRRDSIELDSLRQLNAKLERQHMEVPAIEVEKALVRDSEEDRLDGLRKLANMKTNWRKEATIMLQLTQNYVSPNWYQGGNSSLAMLGLVKGSIGYYGKHVTWENTLDWRECYSTVSGDTLRKLNVTEDLFRIYSKAGVKILDKLYGSLSAEYEMHLLPVYEANTKRRKSDFASPMRFNLALGLDYKPVKGLSLVFSPIAYKMVFVGDTVRVNPQDYGVPEGERVLNDVGSSIRVEYLWKPVREVAVDSKLYFYTNYQRVEVDLEVNCDFIINRFLSARLSLHPRYDNTVVLPNDEKAKPQFKELLSIGFAHKFY